MTQHPNLVPKSPSGSSLVRTGTVLISVAVIVLFCSTWVWALRSVWSFVPTETAKTLAFEPSQVTVLTFLATALGTGTAAVLGITVVAVNQKNSELANDLRSATETKDKALVLVKRTGILWFGLVAYLAVGVWAVLTWYFRGTVAPETVSAFGSSVLGWLGGGLAVVFKADTGPN